MGGEWHSVDLPECFGRWPPWHWGWAGQKQEQVRGQPLALLGERAPLSMHSRSPSCAAASGVAVGLLPLSWVSASGEGHANAFYGARTKYFLVAK